MSARPRFLRTLTAVTLGATFTLSLLAPVARAASQDATPAPAVQAPADANSALIFAVAHDDLEGVKAALAKGADPNTNGSADYDSLPPLHMAVYLGHKEIVAALLDKGADPKKPGVEGYPILDFVVMNHHAMLRQAEQMKQVEAKMTALFGQQAELMKQQAAQFAAAGVPSPAPRRGGGLFGGMLGGIFKGGLGNVAMAVATGGTSALAQGVLKQVGANVGKQLIGKALGNSPLGNFAQAVLSGNPLSGATALESLGVGGVGSLKDPSSWVNLVQAASKGNSGAVAGLANLAPAAGVGGDRAAWTGFLNAAQGGRVDEVKAMMASGKVEGFLKQAQDGMKDALGSIQREAQERNAKYIAAPEDAANDVAIVKLLLAKGAEVDARDPNMKATALMFAAHEGRADIAEALVAGGANVNAKDDNDMTPLEYCGTTMEAMLAQMNAAGKGGDDVDPEDAQEKAAKANPVYAVLKKAGAK
jgi:hypothetical protein